MAVRTVGVLSSPHVPSVGPRRLHLPAGWPMLAILLLFPLWYVLGLGAFIWIILAVPMLGHLVMARTWRAPRGFIIWVLFLTWMGLSAVQLAGPTDWLTYLFRASTYLAATLGFLYLLNTDSEDLPTERIIWAFTAFWAVIVAGGYLALAFPHTSFPTPTEKLLPSAFLSNRWLYDLVHPSLAQQQALGGVAAVGHAITRPAAPFAYTNWWGANYALLIPFVILAGRLGRSHRVRVTLYGLLLLSLVPFVVSVNRGAWLSVIVAGLYAWGRFALRGHARATAGLFALLVVVALAVVATPLRGVVQDRIEHEGSAGLRLSLYEESMQGALQSPVVGYGVPLPQPVSKYTLPNVGTQGQLWLVLVSVGLPGTFFFLAWLLYVFWASRSTDDRVSFTVHVAMLIALFQIPFYGWMPVEMFLVMAGAALVWRAPEAPSPEQDLQAAESLPSSPSVRSEGRSISTRPPSGRPPARAVTSR